MSRLEKKFRRIAQKLTHLEIQAGLSNGFDLRLDDLFADGRPIQSSNLFLGKYSRDGIALIIKRFGFDRLLRRRGLGHLDIVCDTSDPYRHILRIYHNKQHTTENLVCELVAHQDVLRVKNTLESAYPFGAIKVVNIEWMILQNPTAQFTPTRPPLPGQQYPGLGIGDEVLALLIIMGRHLQVDGLLNVPQYYHTALMFSKRFNFINPQMQATVQTITRDLWKRHRLATIAWAIYYECLYDEFRGKYFVWEPEEQLIPVTPLVRKYFQSTEYISRVEAAMEGMKFRLDEKKLAACLKKSGPNL
ncbi:MAG: hypothetical protein K9N11_01540 [Lentisphaeria bacterium]|nr:hypothetical protein [Candidatus Neomarinimicrobiota bacterium]MCF7841511.1 hypothetical protein [Lentisphaeria bacterium]